MITQVDDATRIRVIRALVGMTSRAFAAELDVACQSITSWEHGRCTPTREKRKRLAEFCRKAGIGFMPSGCPVPAVDLLPSQER